MIEKIPDFIEARHFIMHVLISVKSEDNSISNLFNNCIQKELISHGYSLDFIFPKFSIEVIAEDITHGFISPQYLKDLYNKLYQLNDENISLSDYLIISVIYTIYYYVWDFITDKDSSLQIDSVKEKMFQISNELELNGKYSTGANGVYKHNVYHNITLISKNDISKVSKILVSDFNDMVFTWQEQIKIFNEK